MSEIRVNTFKAEDGISAPSFPNGIQVTGVVTATVLDSTVPFLNAGSNIQLGNAGVVTATTFKGNGDFVELDVDGHTNLDNVNVAGVATFASAVNTGALTASTGTFSGNVSVGGTLTYEDVSNIDSVGLVTARNGINVSGGNCTLRNVSVPTGNISVNSDTGKLLLGASNDLHIFHEGSHSYIQDNGTGALYIGSNGGGVYVRGQHGEESIIANSHGNVSLYYDNSLKFTTETSGVNITGVCTATSFTDSNGNLRSIPLQNETGAHVLAATAAGRVIYISTGGVTVNPSVFSGNEAVTIINNSGSNQTITQGSSMTLYFTSDGSSGNRTLGARGMATVWFAANNIAYISGSGLT